MMKIFLQSILTILFLIPGWEAVAQGKKEKGRDFVNRYAYARAIPYLKKCARKGDTECESMIADCYRKTFDYENAAKWYSEAVTHDDAQAVTFLHYGHLLMQNKRFDEAHAMFVKYSEHVPHDGRGKAFMQNLGDLERHLKDSLFVVIDDLPFNTIYEDFGATPYNDGIVFASARDEGSAVAAEFKWLGSPFLDLYFIPRKGDNWGDPDPIRGEMNSKYHESNFTFDEASGFAWFTRNNLIGKEEGYNDNNIILLKIYGGKMNGKECNEILEFPFNDDHHSVTHPFVTPGGDWLYFVSDQPGGFGGKDIYRSKRQGDSWAAPENLGNIVNTPGDEVFPFVHTNGTLFFSSDGQPGLGHLDIFRMDLNSPESFVHNLGYPINTAWDDFGYYLDSARLGGFLSSNRPGGKGMDDLYSFRVAMTDVFLSVYDSIARLPLEDVRVTIFDGAGMPVMEKFTNYSGNVNFTIQSGLDYSLTITSPEFEPVPVTIGKLPALNITDTVWLYNPPPAMVAIVVDSATRSCIAGATVFLIDKSVGDTVKRISDRNGRFAIQLRRSSEYNLYVKAPKYLAFVSDVKTTIQAYDGDTVIPLRMEPIRIGEPIVLKNIHYEFDRAVIREMDYPEFQKVIDLMLRNPEIQVEMSSHTDCRGSAWYNEYLSQRRAESALTFLIANGIGKERITARGYGESKLLNTCSDGVNCSETDHAFNRRTEFTITGLTGELDLEKSVLDTRIYRNGQ